MLLQRTLCLALVLLLGFYAADSGRARHRNPLERQGTKHKHRKKSTVSFSSAGVASGLWPSVFNLATKSWITTNATCGENGVEEYCRPSGKCSFCDAQDTARRHPIEHAIDGSGKWWQSPAIYYGREYEWVTIDIDLKQVYQITFVKIKAANSPRPGTWILERSIDGDIFYAWQYFARTNKECIERFGITPTKGKPRYSTDTEVICTSFYSKITPLENGEIHTSLIYGRPGANETSPELLEFTKARFVRLRFMGLRSGGDPDLWVQEDGSREKSIFYSIRDISIEGQCVCNGHAETCRHNVASGHPECECVHHTCGANCERCCPLHNQSPWGPGTARDPRHCVPCNCHGHATACHYDEEIDKAGLSMDMEGNYRGGGVCDNCTNFTTGINCERCLPLYYRATGVSPSNPSPCLACECEGVGCTGGCVPSGPHAGTCHCREGYSGDRCERCAPGYRGFPDCEICPCDAKGVIGGGDCEGECVCKANVEGKYCDRCKPGYFGLRGDYEDGCASCYCSGATTVCESDIIRPETINMGEGNWKITNLLVTQTVSPTEENGLLSIGNYELPNVESLYWLAPPKYSGKHLEIYSSFLTFKVHWIIMRGDTSGEPTIGPNIILIGNNGMKIAYGNELLQASNATFEVKLNERGWFHIKQDVKDIVTRPKRTEYQAGPVSRADFLNVLIDIKYFLLRATFHTDQIEAMLEEAYLQTGRDLGEEEYSPIEKCSCPSGYSGLSCEICSFGYVRIEVNTSTSAEAFCAKCDCNGHSETCIPSTGECFCQHNTIGERCDRCAAGYYGNPLKGSIDDCKRCACPLENPENNFSPSCQLDYYAETEEDEGGYVCTQCPEGYTGDHCDVCDGGYFGDPLEIGSTCKPCDCKGGPCDSKTGQCLSCKGNTEGFKCERCKTSHYGNASQSDCKACQCDHLGSQSQDCDAETGQCFCKDRFTGRECDKCQIGYGNVTSLCTPCSCNLIGSVSEICDQHSGLCECRPGVEGFHCDACQNFYYGFSETGCKECACSPDGSKFATCDEDGQCRCKPNFIGKKCDQCKDGFWKDGSSCSFCNCDLRGAISNICDKKTGACTCQPGVGGSNCNACSEYFYGDLVSGCKACDPCDLIGHICHPENGRCVCPSYTTGDECERCEDYAWGYEPRIGCRLCDCSISGSTSVRCDDGGVCSCKEGYEGEKCEKCAGGYFGYPICRPCQCNVSGTIGKSNDCTADGQCFCKSNVEGLHCEYCVRGTFGLDENNPDGCNKCFCFGRSTECTISYLTSYPIRSSKPLEITYDCINNAPCWILPEQFVGDLTASYGGYLEIISNLSSPNSLTIYLSGNGVTLKAVLSGLEISVILNEYIWDVLIDPKNLFSNCRRDSRRDCFMTVLQNVSDIFIEKNGESIPLTHINIEEVLLYNGTDYKDGITAISVENCTCPKEYTSLSCQTPNNGYYRYFPQPQEVSFWVDTVVGVSRKCNCHGHSNACVRETGECLHCEDNTAGFRCEICAEGFYRQKDSCLPCECPSAEKNFASRCQKNDITHEFICTCKQGYVGAKCDKCAETYFGDPQGSGGCQECECNLYGRIDNECDKNSGRCRCKAGFSGKKCNQCTRPMEVIENGKCTPCDECTQMLFQQLDDMSEGLNSTIDLFKGGVGPPWKLFNETVNHYLNLRSTFGVEIKRYENLLEHIDMADYENSINSLKDRVSNIKLTIEQDQSHVKEIYKDSKLTKNELQKLENELYVIIDDLNSFGQSHIDVDKALKEANKIYKEIKRIAKKFKPYEKYSKTLAKCSQFSSEVSQLYNNPMNPKTLKSQLNDFRLKLGALNEILNHLEEMNGQTRRNLESLKKRLVKLNKKIARINELTKTTTDSFENIIDKMDTTRSILDEITKLMEIFKNANFGEIYDDLDRKTAEEGKSFYESEDYREKVKEHVLKLQKFLNHINSSLNFTKEEWDKIRAGEAYEKIIKGIQEAKQKVNEAEIRFKEASEIIDPGYPTDSLVDYASIALAFSDRLKKRIMNLNNCKAEFNKIANDIEKLKYNILQNGKSDNDISEILPGMRKQLEEFSEKDLLEVQNEAKEVLHRMGETEKEIKTINFTSQHDLFKNFNNYLDLIHKQELDKLKVNLTQLELSKIDTTIIDRIREQNMNANSVNPKLEEIGNKVQELRNKIIYARQLAQSVEIPSRTTGCSWMYKFENSEILTSIHTKFVCFSNCAVFNLTSQDGDFMYLNVNYNDGLLYFGTNQIKESTPIKKESLGFPITIDISKSYNDITVKLNSSQGSLPKFKFPKKFFIIEGLRVGEETCEQGVTCDPKDSKSSILRFNINNKPFGLWNFFKNEGNCAVKFFPPEINNVDGDYFDGTGYRLVNVTRYKDKTGVFSPKKYEFQTRFSTFDENSLILLARDMENLCTYFSLYLEDGHVAFILQNESPDVFKSKFKCNNGFQDQEIKIKSQNGNQFCISIRCKSRDSPVEYLDDEYCTKRSKIFRTRKTDYYIGGVSPIFTDDNDCIKTETRSFIGYLRPSQEVYRNMELITSHGIKTSQQLNSAIFNEKSYLKLNISHVSDKKFTMVFIIIPKSSNGQIMLIEDLVVELVDNHIRLSQNSATIESKQELLQNMVNYVSIRIDKKKTVLHVNVEDEPSDDFSPLSGETEMVLGSSNAEEIDSFIGEIKFIEINGRQIYFDKDTVEDFSKVDIGRHLQIKSDGQSFKNSVNDLDTNNIKDMQSTQSCSSMSNFVTDPGAVKFGDKQDSFIYIKNAFWKRNYEIEFLFRTYYPRGVLFVAAGPQQQNINFVLLEIRQGSIYLHFSKGKKKKRTIHFSQKINDGVWHHIRISQSGVKKMRRVTVSLDTQTKKPLRVPKVKVNGEIYLGGAPYDFSDNAELRNSLIQFRGCMKEIKINQVSQVLVKNKDTFYSNIGQCFPNIEMGAYFGGDAYATYRSDFRVNKFLELSFEFRTTELNGILLSVSNPGNSPALSVELQNGAIAMTIDIGNGIVSNVTKDLDSEFALCNNRWHNVTVSYSNEEMTVNVDGIRRSWVQSEMQSMIHEMEAPLYIGGIPDDAAVGTLKIRENFKGCIRKIVIEGEMMDWTDIEELNNVLLNSCPVSS